MPRQDEEVIVGQCTMLVRVNQSIDVKAISNGIVLLEDLQSLGVILDLSLHGEVIQRVAVDNRHNESKLYNCFRNSRAKKEQTTKNVIINRAIETFC